MKEDPTMPVFTLLAQDKLAAETVDFWLFRAKEEGVSEEKLLKVMEHRDALAEWAKVNPDRVKKPD